MAQSIVLSVSGLYTSMSNYQGLPPGALEIALNVESRYRNVLEPRRGFENLTSSFVNGVNYLRLTNFWVAGVDSVIALTSDHTLVYYTGANPSPLLPGNVVTNILPPDSINGKTRFVTAGQNLYITAQDGVRSLASGSASSVIRAGVPKGLNLSGVTDDTLFTGFLTNNTILSTTGSFTISSRVLTNLGSTTGVAVDEYVAGFVSALLIVQDLTYISNLFGQEGNLISIAYTSGGTAGSEIVTVVGNTISIQIQSGTSTATQIQTAVNDNSDAFALVTVNVTGTGSNAQTSAVAAFLVGGLDNIVPSGTKVSEVTQQSLVAIILGDIASGSVIISNCTTLSGISVGQLITGTKTNGVAAGIALGSKVVSFRYTFTCSSASATINATYTNNGKTFTVLSTISSGTTLLCSGTGPSAASGTLTKTSGTGDATITFSAVNPNVTMSLSAIETATSVSVNYSNPLSITLTEAALSTATNTPVIFYYGSQVAYRAVFGRVETDIQGNTITRLGAPSSQVIITNIEPYSVNTTLLATLPKNSSDELTLFQLYRGLPTDQAAISPLDQYGLVFERNLAAGDFTARVITVDDSTDVSLVGIPLYSGSDQEGALQSNDPPPMAWDLCKFQNFSLFGNITRPSSVKVSIIAVGSPSGVQAGDTITIAGSFLSVPFSEVYTAAGSENQASRQFKVFTTGSSSQNIADTADSLIAVVNYDNSLPVHAILVSTATDLPGQIVFEADNPSYDTFTLTASAHADAYDPVLTALASKVTTINNGVGVSKNGELEAVPATNLIRVNDTSSDILRLIPLRDYVIVIKTDGIYKIQGTLPGNLVVSAFDLTTKCLGADTVVTLNSGVWMFSNQGVVSISDGGVDAKSVPIDNQFNYLINSFHDNLINTAFAVGYESDRKYILFLSDGDTTFAETQYNFNYVTNSWTTWERNFYSAFIHSNEGKMYVGRADPGDTGISRERKTGTYTDYVDEAILVTISVITQEATDTVVVLADATGVEVGDILYQTSAIFSPIAAVNLATSTITTQYPAPFTLGSAEVQTAYLCQVEPKQIFGDNPAFLRQFSEGIILFKNTRFDFATLSFVSDFSKSASPVTIYGSSNGLWGLFPWGEIAWGGVSFPSNIRFLIPQDKQIGSYLLTDLQIKQGFSNFIFQGISISFYNQSQEVGLT